MKQSCHERQCANGRWGKTFAPRIPQQIYCTRRCMRLECCRRYNAANPTDPVKKREWHRRWTAANRAKRREWDRLYRAANQEKIRNKKRRYYVANSKKINDKSRQWAAANPEKVREKNRRWAASNREKMNEYRRLCKRDHSAFQFRALQSKLQEIHHDSSGDS